MSESADRIAKKEEALQAELRRFKRSVLAELMELLTPSQLDKFKLIFGSNDPDRLSIAKVWNAIRLCDSTIERNKADVLGVIAERHAEDT